MEDKKEYLIKYIREKIEKLEELGKQYSDEKIEKLVSNLLTRDRSIEELTNLIDNKLSYQVRKINHNKHLLHLKEYYLSNINKLKKGNNCYLLSYNKGVKVLEQAKLEYVEMDTGIVTINGKKKAIAKTNDVKNDYDLVLSDIAYIVGIPYAKTYRIFGHDMMGNGILNECFDTPTEKFLNFSLVLQFVKEESSKFALKEELVAYHDRNIKKGFKCAKTSKEYKDNIEFVFKLFQALPDINKKNIEELKKAYLNMKVFEILTNSVDNSLNNIGLIIDKEKLKYTYRLSPAYNKCTIRMENIDNDSIICNFFIVKKDKLLELIVNNYYDYVKELLNLIVDNGDTLLPIINQVLKEHLEYEEYIKYSSLIDDNYRMISNIVKMVKIKDEDKNLFLENNELYANRIVPFVDDYTLDDDSNKGSVALSVITTAILVITLVLVGLAIYYVSKT